MQGNRWNRVVNEIVLHTTGRNGKRKLQRQGSKGRANCKTRSKPETNCVPVAERARRGVPSKSRYHWRGRRTKFRNKVDSRRDPCSKSVRSKLKVAWVLAACKVHLGLLAVVVSQWRTEMSVKLGLVNFGGGLLRSGIL